MQAWADLTNKPLLITQFGRGPKAMYLPADSLEFRTQQNPIWYSTHATHSRSDCPLFIVDEFFSHLVYIFE